MADRMSRMPSPGPPPGGGMPPMPSGGPPGGPPGGGDPIRDNASFMNPADLAMKKQEGGIQPGMTVRAFLEQQGIDVEGPIDQLTKFALKQSQNKNMRGKAQSMAGGQPPGGPPPGGPPAGPPQPQGMAGLLKGAM